MALLTVIYNIKTFDINYHMALADIITPTEYVTQ